MEGYLFPDTYQFVKGMTPEEILARMVARMREKISPELLAEARARDLSLHQVLTLASIIEKEAVETSEMPLISAVFWNRIRKDMPLAGGSHRAVRRRQGPASGSPARISRWTRRTTRTAARVCRRAPSRARAARPSRRRCGPARVDYLYFVSLDERFHTFSTTLADHNAAVARYRLARARPPS